MIPTKSPERLIRRREVQHLTGLGRSSIYTATANGGFPAPVHIGPRALAWIDSRPEAAL